MSLRASSEAATLLTGGLAAIRQQYQVPGPFPPAVVAEAEQAAQRPLNASGDRDARHIEFVTLDPATSTDLDQAYHLGQEADTLVLSYAIADVGFFVDRNSELEREAWRRGSTVYCPDGREPQYPDVLCEGAASLLPDVDRPAVVLTVHLDADGNATLRNAQRRVIRSRAKLAYETVSDPQLGPLVVEFSTRVAAAENRRGATRIEFPEQDVEVDASSPGGFKLVTRQRHTSEDTNSSLSLAANMAVADCMFAASQGLFRVMAEPSAPSVRALRHRANMLGINWLSGHSLRQLGVTLDPNNPKHVAFLLAARRAGGGASYAAFEAGQRPWHSAIAATYAHATAPLRRLADRYVLDLVVELCADQEPTKVDVFPVAP